MVIKFVAPGAVCVTIDPAVPPAMFVDVPTLTDAKDVCPVPPFNVDKVPETPVVKLIVGTVPNDAVVPLDFSMVLFAPIGIKFVVPGAVCVTIDPAVPPAMFVDVPTLAEAKDVCPVPPLVSGKVPETPVVKLTKGIGPNDATAPLD